MSMRIAITLTLPGEAASVPLARRTVAEALRSAGVTADCAAEAQVALSEACTNVFNHAGPNTDYQVVVDLGDENLTMSITDAGAGFTTHAAMAVMPELSAENGRGLALMTAFTDSAAFDFVDGEGGTVRLSKRLRWTSDAPLFPARVDGHQRD
jgi:serine/threonine-protein kinase RsbW